MWKPFGIDTVRAKLYHRLSLFAKNYIAITGAGSTKSTEGKTNTKDPHTALMTSSKCSFDRVFQSDRCLQTL